MDKTALKENKRLLSFISCGISLAATFAALSVFGLFNLSKWTGLCVGGGIFIVSAVIALTVRRKSYVPVAIANSLAFGITVSSLYVYLGQFPSVWQTATVTACTVILFGAFCLLTKTAFFERHPVVGGVCFLAVIAVIEILGAIFVSYYVFGYALFLFLALAGYVLVLSVKAKDADGLIKHIAIISFTVLIFAMFIVLVIVTQGDVADPGIAEVITERGATRKKTNTDPYAFNAFK